MVCIAAFLVLLVGFVDQATAQVGGDRRLVCLNSDGGAHPVTSAAATTGTLTWPDISALVGSATDIRACWVWSDGCPPVKRLPGADLEAACSTPELQSTVPFGSDLVLRVPNLGDSPDSSSTLTLTAAPSEMWREVPRSLLPVWDAESSVVRLSNRSGPWRVHACAKDRCSLWTDVPEGAGEVSLSLHPARVVVYLATADGAPLADVRFYLVRPGRSGLNPTEILGLEQSDEDGRVTLRLSGEQGSAVVVSAQGRDAVAYRTLGDVPNQVELEPGFFLSGRVVDTAGNPVTARMNGRSFIRDGFGLTQLQKGRTGADGRFRLAGFSAGAATLRAVADVDGDLEFARRLDVERSVDLGDVILSDVETVWVRIVDAQHRLPVDGALIRAADGQVTRTGADGLSLVQVRFGRELQVTARGYGVSLPRLPPRVGRAADSPFLIELEPALSVTGVYVAADGITPASNGRFIARGAGDLLLTGTIGADGAFTVDLPGGGDWEIELSAGNVGSVRLDVTGPGGETIDLGLVRASPSAVVSGYVVGDNHQPLVGVSVGSTLPSEAGPLMAPLLGRTLNATSDAEGYFELHGLAAGPVGLRIATEGYAPRRLEVSIERAERIDLGTIALDRGRQITVRSDTEGGLVELAAGDALPHEEMTAVIERRTAVFRTVPKGPLAIVVLNGEGQPVCTEKLHEPEGDLSVLCDDRSVSVTGRVTLDGVPVAGRLLWRSRSDEVDVPGGFVRSRSGGLERVNVVSSGLQDLAAPLDGEGFYRLASVLPGEWEVLWVPEAGGAQEPQVVEVPNAGGHVIVRDIAYDGVSVEGAVFDPDGGPADRATVEAFPGQPSVVSDSQGTFRMLGMQPGRYQIRARRQQLRSDLVEVELSRPGDRASVRLHLSEEPVSDRFRLELTDGSAGFCFVETDTASGNQVVQVRDGLAEVPVDPPLGEVVRAACNAEGRWVLGDWQSLPDVLERGLAFDPTASTASLALIGRSRDGGVTISTPGGWDLGQLRMWFGGTPTFSVGETIANLPVGTYLVRRGDEARTVVGQRRRITEVDLDA